MQVIVRLAGHPETAVACHGRCRAAQTCPAHCERPSPPPALRAGQTGHLTAWRFDRFGNRITTAAGEVPLLATGSGSGSIRTQMVEMGNGSLEIRYAHVDMSKQSMQRISPGARR